MLVKPILRENSLRRSPQNKGEHDQERLPKTAPRENVYNREISQLQRCVFWFYILVDFFNFIFQSFYWIKNFCFHTSISKRLLLLLLSDYFLFTAYCSCFMNVLFHFLCDDIIIFKVFFWSLLSLFPLPSFYFPWWLILVSDFPHWVCSFLNSVKSVTTCWNAFILKYLVGSLVCYCLFFHFLCLCGFKSFRCCCG